MPFPQSLTTAPFVRSSTGWFEVSSCKPTSGDLLPSLVKHRKLSLAFVTHVRQAARAWLSALERAGISDFRWHDLRHTWASWRMQNGTPLEVLMQLGGWNSYEMVLRYAHLS